MSTAPIFKLLIYTYARSSGSMNLVGFIGCISFQSWYFAGLG